MSDVEVWEIDEPDEDEPDSWDDDYYADDVDDEPREPNCFDCYDSGIDCGGHDPCRSCQPSWLRRWCWEIRFRWHCWLNRWRRKGSEPDDPWGSDGPF